MTCRIIKPLVSSLVSGVLLFTAGVSYSQVAAVPVTPETSPTSTQFPALIKTVIQVKTFDNRLVDEDYNLSATVDMPNTKPVAVVVVIPGAGAEDRTGMIDGKPSQPLTKIALELAVKGIAVVRYDKFGVGKSLRHDGDLGRSDLRRFAQDATAALLWARQQKPFDGLPVYAFGRSEGGLIALSLAWQAPKLVTGIICIDTPSSTPWVWLWRQVESTYRKQGMTETKIESFREEFVQGVVAIINNQQIPALHPEVGDMLYNQNQDYQRQLFKINPLAYAKELKVPSLFGCTAGSGYAITDAQKLAETAVTGGSKSVAKALVSSVAQSAYSTELALLISNWIKGIK